MNGYKILYPIKFEEFSLDLLSCVLSFKDAGTKEVVLLYVIDVARLPIDKYEGYSPEDVERFRGIAERKMEEAGFNARTRLRVGKAGKDLVEIAREEDVSLIVMGTHGKGFVEGFLWGSASRDVVKYSDRPALLIKGSEYSKGSGSRSALIPNLP